MAQLLRPDSNVTQSGFTGGFAEIDEATASNVDFAYGANGGGNILEVGLSNPQSTPGSGTTTIRYRVAKVLSGALNGSGNAVTGTLALYQGTTLIAEDAGRTLTNAWAAYTWTPDVSTVSDWTDLRLRFTDSSNGGKASNHRGGAISWAELEAPDAPLATTYQGSAALSGTGDLTATGTIASAPVVHQASASLTGTGTQSFAARIIAKASAVLAATGAVTASAIRTVSGALTALGGSTASFAGKMIGSGSVALSGSGTLVAYSGGSVAPRCNAAKNQRLHRHHRGYRRLINRRR